ncbi:hypothetical protein AcW1_008144 [Taiwanofungus camphoratus]|nr:hypothetical protein AcV5_008440 [Antrodia cinnamomea]KAI0950984.1 hypothetical protein AcW1_008144 [Antrodia cinnamomea]KAI0955889.1 hypothetical protein AcV7_006431 [Antrodia cinnamomea]
MTDRGAATYLSGIRLLPPAPSMTAWMAVLTTLLASSPIGHPIVIVASIHQKQPPRTCAVLRPPLLLAIRTGAQVVYSDVCVSVLDACISKFESERQSAEIFSQLYLSLSVLRVISESVS